MKKLLISTIAVALVALMIANAYAVTVPEPWFCPDTCWPRGFTPGFWKHNIQVRLTNAPYLEDLTNGAYNAFGSGPLDGVKLTDTLMDGYLAEINAVLIGWGYSPITFDQALANLQLQGNNPLRTNTANWFNWAAGYGPF